MNRRYWMRFREMDGSWSGWSPCSYDEYLSYDSTDPDVQVRVTDMNEEFYQEEIYGGDYFSLEDWEAVKKYGYVSRYDGSGRWCFLNANKELELQGGVYENDVFIEAPPSWANGVMWYNK